MSQQQITAKKQQGTPTSTPGLFGAYICLELQLQYTNYKNTLQQLAQKIGDVEQETEEHKYVRISFRCISSDFATGSSGMRSSTCIVADRQSAGLPLFCCLD